MHIYEAPYIAPAPQLTAKDLYYRSQWFLRVPCLVHHTNQEVLYSGSSSLHLFSHIRMPVHLFSNLIRHNPHISPRQVIFPHSPRDDTRAHPLYQILRLLPSPFFLA